MAFYFSKDSTFELDNTAAAQQDLTAYVVSIDGLPGERELVEVTALGDSGRTFIPGLENATFTVEFHWSEDASTGPDTVIGPLRTHTSAVDFEFGPEGNVTGDIMYTGTCWVRRWTVRARVGEQVSGVAEFQVEGQVTRAAHG